MIGGFYAATIGYRMASLGDFNGDGIDDVAIGAFAPSFESAAGQVYVLYGGSGIEHLGWVGNEKMIDRFLFGKDLQKGIAEYKVKTIYCTPSMLEKIMLKIPKKFLNFEIIEIDRLEQGDVYDSLNGYNGATIAGSNTCDVPGPFCGTVENNQWWVGMERKI